MAEENKINHSDCWYLFDSSSQSNKKAVMAEEKLRTDELLPLDQAIIWSIDHCGKSLVICGIYNHLSHCACVTIEKYGCHCITETELI